MQIRSNIINPYIPGKTIINQGKIAFKGEFEDIVKLAKTNNSPNEAQKAVRKFFGPKITIEPTKERLEIVKKELPNVTGAWKGLFRGLIEVWEPMLK